MVAADSVRNANPQTRLNPGDWRGARHYTLGSYAAAYGTISGGLNDGQRVWYSQSGGYFRNERDAADIVSLDHTGWYTDGEFCDETARGIVGSLTHGRFIAGYLLSMNDERVYFPEVFTDEIEAARMADEHARVIGERESEHAEQWNAAQRVETRIENNLQRLRECVALRHQTCMQYVRDEITELCVSIRNDRETLATDYTGVL
jgi:hypothetical protein